MPRHVPPAGRRGPRPPVDVAAVVAAGGALGGAARWGVNRALPAGPGGFPWATLVENVAGCLLIGGLMVLLLEVRPPGRYARPFLATGVLGGFTTFSAYTADTLALLRAGRGPAAAAYLAGTALAGLAAVWLGLAAARAAAGPRGAARGRRGVGATAGPDGAGTAEP